MDGMAERDYTPDRAAVQKGEELLQGGALCWKSVADLLDLLPSSGMKAGTIQQHD